MNTAWQKFKDNVPLRRVVVFLLIVACLYEMRANDEYDSVNIYFYLRNRAPDSFSPALHS